ncbi:MAG: dodecin domain-containing protein [Actinobacteria bacterium]|nr:MAG: dodecin domain-containing protein [Actinomycetota bacterium]
MAEQIDRGAIKVIEVIGVSPDGFDDAVRQALAKANESITGITGVEVKRLSASVRDGRIAHYRANVKIAFVVS